MEHLAARFEQTSRTVVLFCLYVFYKLLLLLRLLFELFSSFLTVYTFPVRVKRAFLSTGKRVHVCQSNTQSKPQCSNETRSVDIIERPTGNDRIERRALKQRSKDKSMKTRE